MTKSELINKLSDEYSSLSPQLVELCVRELFEQISGVLQEGGRVEVRGFGSFSLHHRAPRTGRNPKTGEQVQLDAKSVPHFKAGKELRDRVNCL